MKVRLMQTVVTELEVEVPDELDSLVDVIQAASKAHSDGNFKVTNGPETMGPQATAITKLEGDKEVAFMVMRMGQMLITEEGGMHFRETRDMTIARRKQLDEDTVQQSLDLGPADQPAEQSSN